MRYDRKSNERLNGNGCAQKRFLVGLGIPEETIAQDTLIHAHLGLDSVETVKLSL
ncbi:MAG: hypothetical protein HC781_07295, partial [Leptolyngbyaceae cyanobacterium CSU_1_4]|nr:hypothetical protein [Leptolyngbyaceae cyanobacterium CSU_1_4]